MTAAPRSRNRWIDAFLLLCSMAFAPYFWLIDAIIQRRQRRREK